MDVSEALAKLEDAARTLREDADMKARALSGQPNDWGAGYTVRDTQKDALADFASEAVKLLRFALKAE